MKASRLAAILVLAASLSQGATIISYTATSDPAGSPDGTITAGGSGSADVWALSTTGPGGSFAGNSGGNGNSGGAAGAGNPAWGIWSNVGGQSNAIHTLAGGALSVGQDIGFDFDNGLVDTGATVGVSLRNAANNNLFEFFFTGGGSFYSKNDLGGPTLTSQAYTESGFKFSFTLDSTSGYRASLGSTLLSGALAAGGGDQAITNVRVFTVNNNGGGERDVFFNNLAITPEPSRILFLILGLALVGARRRRRN